MRGFKGVIVSFLLLSVIFVTGCGEELKINKEKIKETIDLVLSYEGGYDEEVKKHISEENFYVCNYTEFYSFYLGRATLEEYESKVNSINNKNGKIEVCMTLNMKAKATMLNDAGETGEEAIGENVPVELILNEKDGEYFIESFIEYEGLEKAIENNKGFK
ncbi:hypothetical protein [Clostridium sp.]|uniref:hypothetical protein n=1 Tax=Clostridium sp. TaxID=1506 RepID=UPI003F3D5D3C